MIALLVITDGRVECFARTMRSAARAFDDGPLFSCRIIVDDSGDSDYHAWLGVHYGPRTPWRFSVVAHPARRGFAEAIRTGWRVVGALGVQYVFHLEDDFTFERSVDVGGMVRVLRAHPHLAQLALLRGPVNADEVAAGGVIEQHPDDYAEVRWDGYAWREHRRHFTTNPSLYRAALMDRGWPEGAESEGRFGIALFADPDVRCAYWGDNASGTWVTHVGAQRTGTGY